MYGVSTPEQLAKVPTRGDIVRDAQHELIAAGRGAQAWATQNRTDPERDPATAALLGYIAERVTPNATIETTAMASGSISEGRAHELIAELMDYILTPAGIRATAPKWALAWD